MIEIIYYNNRNYFNYLFNILYKKLNRKKFCYEKEAEQILIHPTFTEEWVCDNYNN